MDKLKRFTIKDGIKTQTAQLKRWQSILKPEKFEMLQKWATSTNHEAKKGFDVVRGTDLDNFVHNSLMSR